MSSVFMEVATYAAGIAGTVGATSGEELVKAAMSETGKSLVVWLKNLMGGRPELDELAEHEGSRAATRKLATALEEVLGDDPAALGRLQDLLTRAKQEDAEQGNVYNTVQVNTGNSIGHVNSNVQNNYYGTEGPRG